MLRLMLWVEQGGEFEVKVLGLPADAFPSPEELELYVFSGEGGEAELPLCDGRTIRVDRDCVEAICAWREKED